MWRLKWGVGVEEWWNGWRFIRNATRKIFWCDNGTTSLTVKYSFEDSFTFRHTNAQQMADHTQWGTYSALETPRWRWKKGGNRGGILCLLTTQQTLSRHYEFQHCCTNTQFGYPCCVNGVDKSAINSCPWQDLLPPSRHFLDFWSVSWHFPESRQIPRQFGFSRPVITMSNPSINVNSQHSHTATGKHS